MNVFEFLGKPANFRTEKKVVQLVKHFDDVNPKAEFGIYHKKVEFPIYGQTKKDGVFCMVVVQPALIGSDVKMFGRTGKMLTSVDWMLDYYKEFNLQAGVYIGELCCDSCSLEELSGITNTNRVKPLDEVQEGHTDNFEVYFHDYLTICEFISGHSHRGYLKRHALLDSLIPRDLSILGYHVLRDESMVRWFAEMQISTGEEGAVFKQDVEWLAGAKDWHSMKIVRGVHYDLECIGFEEGTGKYAGKVVNLLFRFAKGKTVKAMLGKGWTHKDAEEMFNMWNSVCPVSGMTYGVGQIYHVSGLQPSSKNGLIRLPKVRELRVDKVDADF